MKTFEFNQAFRNDGKEIEFQSETVKSEIFNTLFDGDGYLLIKGFPITNASISKCENEVLNFSFLLGVPVSQNVDNEFICRVQDEKEKKDLKPRGYQHSQALPFHSDRCDMLMLCGINPSPIGGETVVVSGKKIHQQVSSEFPVIYDMLKRPFPFEKRTGSFGDTQPWYTVPVFSEINDEKTLLWYCKGYIEDSQKHSDCPRLNEGHIEALDVMSTIVNSSNYCEQVNLQRGDILIMNSTTTLHARNGYPSGSERLLLRVWISSNNCQLPEEYKDIFGNVAKGYYRGGVWSNELNLIMIPKELSQAKDFIKQIVLAREHAV